MMKARAVSTPERSSREVNQVAPMIHAHRTFDASLGTGGALLRSFAGQFRYAARNTIKRLYDTLRMDVVLRELFTHQLGLFKDRLRVNLVTTVRQHIPVSLVSYAEIEFSN